MTLRLKLHAALASIFCLAQLPACSQSELTGTNRQEKAAGNESAAKPDVEKTSAEIASSELDTADEPLQVSGAFLTECGVALETDTPHAAPQGSAWLGCGVVDSQGKRPANRPEIVRLRLLFADGSEEIPALVEPVSKESWDVIATASATKPGGIAQIFVQLEGSDSSEKAHIVGLDDDRYKAVLMSTAAAMTSQSGSTSTPIVDGNAAAGTATGTDSLLGSVAQLLQGVGDSLGGLFPTLTDSLAKVVTSLDGASGTGTAAASQ